MAYTKYSLTPSNNNAAPPDGAPEGMLPSAVNDTMRDMMAQIRDCGDGIRGGTYTMTAPIITGGSISGSTMSSNVITGGSINNTPIGATTASTGKFSTLTNAALTSGRVTYAGTSGVLQDDADFTFNGTTVTMANDASISGLTVGKGGGAVASNTVVGASSYGSNSTGSFSTLVGYQAAFKTTSGTNDVFGANALYQNTTGTLNVAVGNAALNLNTTGSNNTAIGNGSLQSNTTASNNTAVGYQAGYSNTTGLITAVGHSALKSNTTGARNTAVGGNTGASGAALEANTSGSDNVGVGNVLILNTTGSNNTAVGSNALTYNTTANGNTAVGYQAGYINSTGSFSTYIGGYAGNVATANGNTCVGYQSGLALSTGTSNTYIGTGSGYLMTSGAKNTILGAYNGNQGGLDIRTASNFIVLSDGDGNPRLRFDGSNTALYVPSVYSMTSASAANVFVASDGAILRSTSALKYKQDIRDLESIDINKFRAVRYKSKGSFDDQTKDHFGIIADEVAEAGITELVNYGADGEVEGFQYERLTVVLLKELQDLKKTVEAQALEIATLKGQ